jgi:hypothetical protein
MSDIQVFARVTCPRYDCSGGTVYAPMLHVGSAPPPPRERPCDYCDGKGYVEEWRDLGSLVNEVVRIA